MLIDVSPQLALTCVWKREWKQEENLA